MVMNDSVENIRKITEQLYSISQEQLAETEEITAVLEKITSDSGKLLDLSKIV